MPLSSLLAWRTTPYRRDAAVSTAANVVMLLLGFLTGPVIARVLGPEGRGDIAAVIAPATILTWLLSCGLPTAVAYYVDPVPEGTLLGTTAAFGLVVGGPICAVLWFLCPAYLDGYSSVTVIWARVFLVFLPFSIGAQAALEIRRRRAADLRWNYWRSSPIVFSALAIVTLGVIGRLTLASAFASYFIGGLIPTVFFIRRLVAVPEVRPSMSTLRLILPYAWRALGTIVASSVTARLDQVVLAGFVGPGELGLYAVAVTAASVTSPLATGVTQALFGHLRDERSLLIAVSRFRRTLWLTTLMSTGVAVVIGLLTPLLLRVAFGSAFEGATTALRLLLPGSVAYNILTIMGTKLNSDGRPGDAARAAFLGGIITIVGLIFAIPAFGIEGAAAVTSVAFVLEVIYLIHRGVLRPSTAPVASGSVIPATEL